MTACRAEALLRELSACKSHDPYAKKPWQAQALGRWRTVNVPGELWDRIVGAAAAGGVVEAASAPHARNGPESVSEPIRSLRDTDNADSKEGAA